MSSRPLLPCRESCALFAAATLIVSAWLALPDARAAGARSFKSGPLQVTADGAFVWVANADHDSVSRIETATDRVMEYPLPAGERHRPLCLSVTELGSEVWVTCHDSDRIYVLSGADGRVLDRIDVPWGSGPYGVALSPDQRTALVALHRDAALLVFDVGTRTVRRRLDPVYWSPLGIGWTEGGTSAWVTHLFADGEDPFLTRVDFTGATPTVTTSLIVKSTNPKQSSSLQPGRFAEGGYLTFRGHLAELPAAAGQNLAWIPTQYNNINEDIYTPDSTIQSTIRTVDLGLRLIPNTNADKIILSAVDVHDPANGNYVGPGWNAQVSGPVDINFSDDGATAYVLFEQSNELMVFPTSTPAWNQNGDPPLPEIRVGARPLGLAVSPVRGTDIAWVWNSLDSTVSVVDLAAQVELRTVDVTPGSPFLAPLSSPALLNGARLFHTSADPRVSVNEKVSCASCHPHGEHDGRIWDFQNLPPGSNGQAHGPRSTLSLLTLGRTFTGGLNADLRGQLHRSGDRDELQDFEHTFVGDSMRGTGFTNGAYANEIDAANFNAGLDTDLDHLAAYILSLEPVMRSPRRTASGGLSESAQRGATFFKGVAGQPAGQECAACHVPAQGFIDGLFHDVGQNRHSGREQELPNVTPPHTVKTPTLIGAWTTPPYEGVTTYASTLLKVVQDLADPAHAPPHGAITTLTNRQLRDLEEFVASIDGNTTAMEVAAATDTAAPRVVRVEPASLTTVDIWFDESISPSAATPAAWRVRQLGGADVSITSAAWGARTGDRITLTLDRLERGCTPITYEVIPLGPIPDMADTAVGGAANLLDIADPGNTLSFVIDADLTVTLGDSGYENIDVTRHEAANIGSGLSTWGHASPWLGDMNTAFVRFDWQPTFQAVTGVTSSADILEASVTLEPEWGNTQVVEAYRCLRPWSDPGNRDWDSNPVGGPTWRDASHPNVRWYGANASGSSGGTVLGDQVADYDNGQDDLASSPDAAVMMPAINEPFTIGGAGMTSAYRFFFDNPGHDRGHALRVQPTPAYSEAKFHGHEGDLGLHGPHLTIRYQLPQTVFIQPPEVSGRGTSTPLLVSRSGPGATAPVRGSGNSRDGLQRLRG